MTALVGTIALSAVVLGVLMIGGIFVRRTLITRRERREVAIRARLRSVGLKIAVGADVEIPILSAREAPVFAEMLSEISMAVRGDGRARIGGLAEDLGLVENELRILRSARRGWERATAARVLGQLASPRASEALIAALGDRDRDVRATAARALGHLGAVEAAGSIVGALALGTLPRAVVVETALLLGAGAVPELREASQIGDPRARRTCIELIGHLGHAQDARGVLAFLDDPSADVRAATARTLGRLGSRGSLFPLISALHDPAPFVRGAAAEALGRLRARPATQALLHLVQTDPSWWAGAWAARSLAKIDPARVRAAAAEVGAAPHLLEAADVLAL